MQKYNIANLASKAKNYKPNKSVGTAMVQAIMNGTKTQTRRIVKSKEELLSYEGTLKNGHVPFWKEDMLGKHLWHTKEGELLTRPKYEVSDVMWVRETTKVGVWRDEEFKVAFDYRASPELKKTAWCEFQDIDRFREFHQKILAELDKLGIEPEIDEENERFAYNWEAGKSPLKWKPSIFMPKEACRNFLNVINIRVQRLQDITDDDAIAEGIEEIHPAPFLIRWKNYLEEGKYFEEPTDSFKSLWISINGRDSWVENPFVFVYDFNKINKPKNFL